MQSENFGKPLKVFEFSSNENDNFDLDEIEKFFNNPKIKQRKVVILSIVGAFRRGKSFFLDYCLRYLYANYDSVNQSNFVKNGNWLGASDEKLTGFSWKSGCDRDTTGIVFWSDVFLCDRNDEKLAIFLVDTQGLFDNDTTSGDNAKVFSLTSLLSSIQIINLSGNIREDELQYVSFAMEFAKYATPKMGKPYQNVTFLIRDWQCEEDFEFGHKGGKKYINKVLKGKSEQSKEFESIRNFLIESCEEIQCFLLPHPGKNVAGKKNFNGNWAQLDEDFREELKKTIETLLDPENIIPKKMSGRELKVDEFLPYLKQYFKFFSTKEIPRAVNLFENLIKVELNELVEKCFRIYYHNLTHLSKSIETKSNVAKFHKRINDLALTAFKNCEKMGSHDQIEIAEKSLKSKIDAAYEIWSKTKIYQLEKEEIQKQNEAKLNEIVAAFETEKKKMNDEIYSVKSSFENDKKELENKVESLKSELNTVRVTRNVNSRFDMCSLAPLLPSFGSVSSYPNYISNDCSSSNFYVPSYSSSSSRASSASTSNPWHAHQKSVSKVWSQMSASEKRSAGNFNTFASASYRKGK